MEESADKKLKEHIKNVFDNYDDGLAAEGWAKLRESHPRRRTPILWLTGIASLLVIGVILFKTNTTSVVMKGENGPPNPKNTLTPPSKDSDSANDHKLSISIQKMPSNNEEHLINGAPVRSTFGHPSPISTTEKESLDSDTSVHPAKVKAQVETDAGPKTPAGQKEIEVTQTGAKKTDIVAGAYGMSSTSKSPADSIYGDQSSQSISEKKLSRKASMSVFAGAFFNSADNSKATINSTVGIAMDVRLNKKVRLSVGLSLSPNQLHYSEGLPENSNNALKTKLTQSVSYNNSYNGALPVVSQFRANMFNIGIPVSVKYFLTKNPDKFYVSAGLSSYSYLKEKYTFRYVPSSPQASGAMLSETISYKAFNRFDFARVLDLSLGYRLSSRQEGIVIEPFVKRALGGLGSQAIKFGSTGISLKMNFSKKNQK